MLALCCPKCRGDLQLGARQYTCPNCVREYPIVLGFADFRGEQGPEFARSRDLEIAQQLASYEQNVSFPELLDFYYRLRPEESEELHESHLAHLAAEKDYAESALDLIQHHRPPGHSETVLEIGSGFGLYVTTAAARGYEVAAVDVSLTFLVLTRKRLASRGLLVAAAAECLPFVEESFDAVIAADVIEHLPNQQQSLAEMYRVLKQGAPLFISTPNRFSLTPEPHVGLWGVGYLPRRLANRYVLWRMGISYSHIRLLSAFSLLRLLRERFRGAAEVMLPGLSPSQIERFAPMKRALARLYVATRQLPLVRNIFYLWGPFFHALAVKQ